MDGLEVRKKGERSLSVLSGDPYERGMDIGPFVEKTVSPLSHSTQWACEFQPRRLLFEQDQPLRADEISCMDLVEIYSAWKVKGIQRYRFHPRLLDSIYQSHQLLCKEVVNLQGDMCTGWQRILDNSCRVERIGIVLLEGELTWDRVFIHSSHEIHTDWFAVVDRAVEINLPQTVEPYPVARLSVCEGVVLRLKGCTVAGYEATWQVTERPPEGPPDTRYLSPIVH